MRRLWKRIRGPIATSPLLIEPLAAALAGYLRLVARRNRMVRDDRPLLEQHLETSGPLILTTWHGQHLVVPFLKRGAEPSAMLVSKSHDAALNARIVERAGIVALRGSGGRDRDKTLEKGGIRALISLRDHLATGRSVALIADVPKATARRAGLGIITLARISGCAIVPIAYATSRRHVFEGSWDKTTLNMPFGRAALVIGKPLAVPRDADEATLEHLRQQLDVRLDTITNEAYAEADGKQLETRP